MRQKIALPCKNYSSSVRRQGSVRQRREAQLQAKDDSDYDETVDETEDEDTIDEDRVEIVPGMSSIQDVI